MSRIVILLIVALTATACSTVKNSSKQNAVEVIAVTEQTDTSARATDYYAPETWLLGNIDLRRFSYAPHAGWFDKGFMDYYPDEEVMHRLREIPNDDITITVVLGSWCPDSRREVPRFLKIVELWNYPTAKIRFIGVDMNKVAPLDDYQVLNVERVPTFIFFRNNIEAGRIIEFPFTSLEQDMVKILESK